MAILYNPQNEGRGVMKNPKKTFGNCLQILFSHISVLIKTNILFCLTLVPLALLTVLIGAIVLPDVNILNTGFQFQFVFQVLLIPLPFAFCGPAVSGLTRVLRDIGREIHVDVSDNFFEVFKRTFFKSVILSVLAYFFYIAAFFAFFVYWGEWLFFAITMIATLYFSLMQSYLFLMNISLDLSIFKMYKNAFLLILVDFKNSMKAFVALLAELLIVLFCIATSVLSTIMLALSAVIVLTIAFVIPGLFKNYYLFGSLLKNVVEPFYDANSDIAAEQRDKNAKYDDADSVTEQSEYVYQNGKLVPRSRAEETPLFKDND